MALAATLHISQEDIASFCRRNQIKELALFGSVLRDDIRPDSSGDPGLFKNPSIFLATSGSTTVSPHCLHTPAGTFSTMNNRFSHQISRWTSLSSTRPPQKKAIRIGVRHDASSLPRLVLGFLYLGSDGRYTVIRNSLSCRVFPHTTWTSGSQNFDSFAARDLDQDAGVVLLPLLLTHGDGLNSAVRRDPRAP